MNSNPLQSNLVNTEPARILPMADFELELYTNFSRHITCRSTTCLEKSIGTTRHAAVILLRAANAQSFVF